MLSVRNEYLVYEYDNLSILVQYRTNMAFKYQFDKLYKT